MAPVFLVFPQFLCRRFFFLNHRCMHVCIYIYDEKCISACSDCEEIRFWSWGVGRIESTANRMSAWLEVLRPQDPIGQSVPEANRNTPILFLGTYTCIFLCERDSIDIVKYQWCLWNTVASHDFLSVWTRHTVFPDTLVYNGLWFTSFLLVLSPWATDILQTLNNSDSITV